ncbi:uncharacterized protein LY89DRAFT_686809 [Mollisia scopiformis]|uniref:Zn(2)-C6 fungal-type domain-containing protein n=1 Tax=Mollisia scopiformis TaxID=149040 RepID=A0A194X2C2_MOLSC|nr:uncharacterized protein LY89DRAFT_686809 [Mollisia scopiformis]KUJ14323.1 hypothetical protein LY89DRAFT_686809 [Mollisia scopiformis]
MEVYPGIHQFMCKGCRNVQLHYQCVFWSPGDHAWNCQDCLPLREMLNQTKLEFCPGCVRKQKAPEKATEPIANVEFSSTKQFFPADIVRMGCSSCRKRKISCSRLYTAASKCEGCLEEDLECDCKVMRRTCQYCKDRMIRCTGNEDTCTNCMRFQQECKPVKREKVTKPVRKDAQSAPARDHLDVIDGMKADLSFDNCLSCEKDSMLRCDRNLDGCVHCKIKKQPCEYPSPLASTLSDRSSKFCTSCYGRKSKRSEDPLCDRCKSIEWNKSKVIEPCHACRLMSTQCDDAKTCAQCQKLDFKCKRGPTGGNSSSQYPTSCDPTDSTIPPYTVGWSSSNQYTYDAASRTYTAASEWTPDNHAAERNQDATVKLFADLYSRTSHPPRNPSKRIEKGNHVDCTDRKCPCQSQDMIYKKANGEFYSRPLPDIIRLPGRRRTSYICKVGNIDCSAKSPCQECTVPAIDPTRETPGRWRAVREGPACDPCRNYKHRSDGKAPSFASCERLGRKCSYSSDKFEKGVLLKEYLEDSTRREETVVADRPVAQTVEKQDVASKDKEMKDVTTDTEDLDVEDWCMVTSEDVDGVVEEEPSANTKGMGRSYRFW